MNNHILISIIIPVYNNEGSLKELFNRINETFILHSRLESINYQLVIVDDGSTDNSYNTISEELKKHSNFSFKIIKLTRNFGSYNSFLAGMKYCDGVCCVYLHADLQDPPELIPELYKNYLKGFKLVIANRVDREDNSILSSLYHWTIKNYGISKIPSGGFDLMLFDNCIKEEVMRISEKNTNNVYLISWLGYPYVNIPYKRKKRIYGKSQWSLSGKIRLFVDSIFSFTSIPSFWMRLSLFICLISFFSFLLSLLFLKVDLLILFLAFILLLVLMLFVNVSILAEYIHRVHETVRNRPNFVVEEVKSNS
jgi:glycosyltransferase involved in cell wall biosynthesis